MMTQPAENSTSPPGVDTPPTPSSPNHTLPNIDAHNHTHADLSDCRLLDFLPWANAHNLLSYQTLLLFYRVLGGALTPCISLCGVPVNVLNCAVFYHQGLKERINLLLFLLAGSDLVVSAFLLLSTVEYFVLQVVGDFRITGPLVVFVTNYGSALYGFVYVSGLISTLIAVERCVCITYPMLAKRYMNTATMGIGVSVVSVLMVASIYLVSAQKYRIVCAYHPLLKIRLAVHYPHEFYEQNRQWMDILNTLVNGIGLPSVFVLITTITTVITAVKLKTAARWRQMTSSVAMGTREVALTRMLVVVSCLFIGCTLPNVVLRVAPLVDEEYRLGGRHQNALLAGVNVLYTANAANSAFNFVFYYRMGSKFRAVLRDMVCKRCGLAKKEQPTQSKTAATTFD